MCGPGRVGTESVQLLRSATLNHPPSGLALMGIQGVEFRELEDSVRSFGFEEGLAV